jgi:GMP synthase (glutamine-hydrolysing)
MGQRIVFIEHEPEPRDDRASRYLTDRGFSIAWFQPFKGELLPDLDPEIAGVVVTGGGAQIDQIEQSPYLYSEAQWIEQCLKADLPILGLCLGGQLLAHVLGATVGPREDGLQEFGYYTVQPSNLEQPFVPPDFNVLQSHSRGFEVPDGATLLARGELFPNQAFCYGDNAYGLQFHPEVTSAILLNRWHEANWAPWDQPGTQSRTEQQKLAPRHDPLIGSWFTTVLDRLFPKALVNP